MAQTEGPRDRQSHQQTAGGREVSDAEGKGQRTMKRRGALSIPTRTLGARKCVELERCRRDSRTWVRCGAGSPIILDENGQVPESIRARLVTRHASRSACAAMVAAAVGRGARRAPRLTQQRDTGPRGEQQHDGQDARFQHNCTRTRLRQDTRQAGRRRAGRRQQPSGPDVLAFVVFFRSDVENSAPGGTPWLVGASEYARLARLVSPLRQATRGGS